MSELWEHVKLKTSYFYMNYEEKDFEESFKKMKLGTFGAINDIDFFYLKEKTRVKFFSK